MKNSETCCTQPLLIYGAASERLRALEQVCETRGIAYRTCASMPGRASAEDLFNDFTPWALADSNGLVEFAEAFVDSADVGVTDLQKRLWTAAGLRRIPRLTFLGPHSTRHFRGGRVRSSGLPDPLIIVAPVEPASGREAQTLHTVLNAALDLLIDGESGMWLLPSLQKL